jgi:hypothetical protein
MVTRLTMYIHAVNEVFHTLDAHRPLPCFGSIDYTLRALLQDPAVGYIKLFVIFIGNEPEGEHNAQILFTTPQAVPPGSAMRDFPDVCGSAGCPKKDCGSLEFPKKGVEDAFILTRREGGLVRMEKEPFFHFKPARKLCNHWGCEVADRERMSKCKRCKMVAYCSTEHQVRACCSTRVAQFLNVASLET